MKKEEQIELIKPFMYCYMGSGMLTNEYDEDVAVMMAKNTLEALEKANQLQSQNSESKLKEVWEEACKAQMNEVLTHCQNSPQGTNGHAIKHWVKLVEYKPKKKPEA